MSKIFVIGHKNPDTDSIASACALASLRNMTDKSNTYVAVRCGNANKQTKYIYDRAGVELPPIMKDAFPKVADIMTKEVISVREGEPVLNALRKMGKSSLQVLPVVDGANHFKGLIGSSELVKVFVPENINKRPKYAFKASHIPLVLHGNILHQGEQQDFDAVLVVGAMPAVDAKKKIDMVGANEIVLVTGNRHDVIMQALEQNVAAIVVTGLKDGEALNFDFSSYKGWVYISGLDSAETIRRIAMATPVENIMSNEYSFLTKDTYLDSALDIMMESRQRLLPVIEDSALVGVVTRANLLTKYKNKLILVDHNEANQAVDGVESSDVLEIVDHHRLGAVKTNAPVTFYAKPVGSTCTLVTQLYKYAGILPDKQTALLLMGGIISDTVMLKSPTTTQDDRNALSELSVLAGVDASEYGLDIFSATDSLSARTPESIITTDFKLYDEFGVRMGVAQVEVVAFDDFPEMYSKLMDELARQKENNSLNWVILLITNIVNEESILICTDFPAAEKRFSYRKLKRPHTFSLPGVLSRKKQLLPELLRIVEELS